MEYILGSLEPKPVFGYFEDLTRIPRESNNERQVSDYLVRFAGDNGLEAIQDKWLNVIIRKRASPGYEREPGIILQGHLDMVCVKRAGSGHDFKKDPVGIFVDGDLIRARETSLGADNGIAVAMAMAILADKNAEHPALEALFTTAEETGMDGAGKVTGKDLKGRTLINMDSGPEGVFLASCAGGVRNYISLPVFMAAPKGDRALEIGIEGLLGGHSGVEIDKNRANAIKLLARLLEYIGAAVAAEVASVEGGEKENAIAKFAKARVVAKAGDLPELAAVLRDVEAIFKKEYETADPGLVVVSREIDLPQKVFSQDSLRKFVLLTRLIPDGVATMSSEIKGLVASSSNLGILQTMETEIKMTSSVRSSVRSLKDEINGRIAAAAELTGAGTEKRHDYPEWQFKRHSPIRDLMTKTYRELTGKEAKIEAIHAGLECGILGGKLVDVDMISIGPNMHDAHTTGESLEIASTARTFAFLKEVLKRSKHLSIA